MGKDFREVGTLTERQLLQIQKFLSDDEFYERSLVGESKEWLSEDEDLLDNTIDAEEEAGVIEWGDFGFEENSDDSRPALVRNESKERKKLAKNTRWLQGSLVATVGNLDLMVFANVQKVVVVEKIPSENSFQVIGEFIAADLTHTPTAYIRCLCVLPISSSRRTETSDYDWTAIAVGMSDGSVRFFTERGVLLRSERVSEGPVEEIRLGKSLMAGNQEFAVLSKKELISIEGLSLYVALKAAKSQVARGETDLEKINASAKLNAQKLKLESNVNPVDFAVTGPLKATWFDVFVAATLSPAGFNAKIGRTTVPTYSTYLLAGPSPYVGFGWHEFGASQNVLADALYNFGTQLTSSVTSSIPSFGLRSFLGIGVSRKDRPVNPPLVELKSSGTLYMRTTIVDGKREGERVYIAPSQHTLAAVTDSLARVVLLDTRKRQVIRMWKGYRDARCAWLESISITERKRTSSAAVKSTALFLVIFAPRRGLLEAWSMQNGGRVFAATVDRRGRLLGVPRLSDQMLGCDARGASYYPAVYFLSSSGKIHRLCIPFHRAVANESGGALHDANLLKEMAHMARKKDVNSWLKAFRSLKSPPTLRESFDFMWRDCDFEREQLRKVLESVSQIISIHKALKAPEESASFMAYMKSIVALLNIYVFLEDISKNASNTNKNMDDLTARLHIDKEAFEKCMQYAYSVRGKRIKTDLVESDDVNGKKLTFSSFAAHFNLNQSSTQNNEQTLSVINATDFIDSKKLSTVLGAGRQFYRITTVCSLIFCIIVMQKSQSTQRLETKAQSLGRFIFSPVLSGQCTVNSFMENVFEPLCAQEDLIELLCIYWLNSSNEDHCRLPELTDIFEHFVEKMPNDDLWLAKVEKLISESRAIDSALLLCLVARSAAITMKRHKDCEKGLDIAKPDDWDSVEVGLERWDVILRHLQCAALLRSLLGSTHTSLADLTRSGLAFYREQVGKWAAENVTDPHRLYEVLDGSEINEKSAWEFAISELLKLFPHSMKAELVICDCAWESISLWRKRKEKNEGIVYLKKAVSFISLLGGAGRLQHGLCVLVWDTFLKQPFRYIYDFLSRKSSLYKSLEECKINLKQFPGICTQVLQMLRDSIQFAEDNKSNSDGELANSDCQYEDFLVAFFEVQRHKYPLTKKPLSTLSREQKAANFALVCHHHQLAMIIELQMTLEEWPPGPKTLFDSVGDRAFFESFYTHPLVPMDNVPESVRERREHFLAQCVKHSGSEEFTEKIRLQIYDLLYAWKLDVDEIKLKEIIALYEKGIDRKAEQYTSVVENLGLLPYSLFDIALARIRKWFDTSSGDLYGRVAQLSLLDYSSTKRLRRADLEVTATSPEDIAQLLRQVRILLGRLPLNDQSEEVAHLSSTFEKAVIALK